MFKVIIIDDEPKSRETLKNLLQEYCSDVSIEGMADSVDEAVGLITKLKPDLIFLDIEMQTATGFDLLKRLEKHDFEVIFITAYEQYALKAIKFSALDYLLKPIDINELKQAIDKYKRRVIASENKKITQLLQNIQSNAPKRITLSTSEGLLFIDIDKIIRCEAQGAYTLFHIKDSRKIMVSKNLKEYQNLLTEHGFFRLHNSHLINIKEVHQFIKSDGGIVVLKDGSKVAISANKKEEFLELMKLM